MENNCNHYADITLALALKLGGTGGWKALQLPAQKREERVVCATVCGFIQWLETRRQKSRKIWFFLSRGAQHVTVFLIKEQSRMVGWPAVIQRSIVNNIVMERKTSIFDRFAKRRNERRMRERAKRERKGRRRRISTLSLADSSFPLFRSDASDARSNPRRKGNYYPGGW